MTPPPGAAPSLADRLVLALVRWWVTITSPLLIGHTAYKDGRLPNPAQPTSTRDKMLWRKIFDRNPLFVTASDKLACKAYARRLCPELKFAEVLWSGSDPAQIPDALLEGEVVVKANHGSGWYALLQGPRDIAAVKRQAAGWAGRRFGWRLGEWAYGRVTRGVLVEEMLLQDGRPVPKQYRFHVAGGEVAAAVYGRSNRGEERVNHQLDELGRTYAMQPDGSRHLVATEPPPGFAKASALAKKLAADFDYLRCDFYVLDGEIYFSELTVYPLSGHGRQKDQGPRARLNALWDIRRSWFMTTPQRGWRRRYAEALGRWLDAEARSAEPVPPSSAFFEPLLEVKGASRDVQHEIG